MTRILIAVCALLLAGGRAAAFEPFTITDIRLEGLQRTSPGTVFTYLPIKVGDRIDLARSPETIRALFKTGFFQDIRLERDGTVLVIFLRERPAVAQIDISGNESIETDLLKKSLRDVGLAEGRVFDRSVLDRVEQELRRQYFSQGKYGVKLETEITPLERNRVALALKITEGWVAKIRQINIVGNTSYEDEELLDEFELGIPGSFSFFSSADQYSKQKLSGDLERLRSWYLDRGFINFGLESTQVAITPDKRDVYITINISEGDRFKVSEVRLAGDLVVAEEELRALVKAEPGSYFSRKAATETATVLSERLGDEGYAFANVNTVPDVNPETREVALTFFIDPGKRIYVRRVNVTGNTRTHDEVVRREIRQMEGGWLSGKGVRLSRERLDRLGYFESVNIETPPVPGSDDQVDVNFSVVEKPSGNFIASVGYSDTQGVIFNLSVNQDNFLGQGTRVSLTLDNSEVSSTYSFSYENPYYTLDGVSRGFSVFLRETDAAEANVSDYTTDTKGGSVNYGIPLTETDRLRFDVRLENTLVEATASSPTEITDFLAENGDEFDTITLTTSWSRDSRDRAFFATRGSSIRASLSASGGDLEYYKVNYDHRWFYPLTKSLTLSLKGILGFGDGYGDTADLPFFENYFSGGIRSVRGYDGNSLGPRDSNGNPIGGNLRVQANAELVFPFPGVEDSSSVRMSAFLDVGNVFNTKTSEFDSNELRASVGFALNWFSPVGPLIFSWAEPINDKAGDELESFQFSLGFAF